jgi:glycosyltransferase involved in cell wall biosynthesis
MYNWAKNKPVHSNGAFRRKYNLEDRILFFYGGNLGHAQDIGNLLRLAEKFKDKKDITFIFLGAGDEAVLVTEKMKELDNILYIEPVSQEQFKLILSDVDIGLFSLSRSHETHNFPGKLLGYMVQDIPILGSVNPGNDIIETVNKHKAGLVSVNGDDELLYKNANKLYEDSHLRKSMGLNARYLLNSLFSVESAVDIILENYIR